MAEPRSWPRFQSGSDAALAGFAPGAVGGQAAETQRDPCFALKSCPRNVGTGFGLCTSLLQQTPSSKRGRVHPGRVVLIFPERQAQATVGGSNLDGVSKKQACPSSRRIPRIATPGDSEGLRGCLPGRRAVRRFTTTSPFFRNCRSRRCWRSRALLVSDESGSLADLAASLPRRLPVRRHAVAAAAPAEIRQRGDRKLRRRRRPTDALFTQTENPHANRTTPGSKTAIPAKARTLWKI